MTTAAEKLNIKVFLGDSLTPEDFSFSQLSSSTNTGSIIPPTTNDLWFSSTQPIPTHIDESERIKFFTEQGKYNQYMGSVKKVEPDKIRETFNNNIMTVLFYLFPTYYKSTPNIHNSYDDRVPHNGVEKINAPILQKYKKVSDGDVVYYKGNTVLQLTWKNDVFNVPEFQTLFSAIYKFYVWSKTQGMQKTNTDLQKFVKNTATSSVGKELEKNIGKLSDPKQPHLSRNDDSTPTDKNSVRGILDILKTKYDSLKTNYESRNEQEKKEKTTPETEKVASKKEYDDKQQTVVTDITEQISKLKLYDEHERDSSRRTPLADMVNSIIGQFKDLIVNRSIYNVFEKNEYIFSTGSSNDVVILSKEQQDIYKYLTENYPEYAKMAEAVKNFREVVKKTANPELDTLCNNFFNNNESRNLLYFILHIQKNFLSSTQGNIVLEESFKDITNEIGEYSNSAELYYVGGINQKSNGNWLIYIGLDAIRGKVNQKKVKECLFGNERLGNLFVDLTATAQKALVKNYFYDVIADGSPDVSTGGPQGGPQGNPQGGPQGGGTRKHKRRRKKRITKTRRTRRKK